MGSGAGAAGAGAGAGSAYAGSCCAQRFACRRLTRLETEVAVPATTAVRAIPRRRPGIRSSFRSSRQLGGVERIDEVLHGNALEGDGLPAVPPHGGDERRGPAVLVDEQRRATSRLERVRGGGDVVLAEQARGGALERDEVADVLVRQVTGGQARDRAVVLLT